MTGRPGDLVIVPIVDGTFSVSVVGDPQIDCTLIDGTFSDPSMEDTHVGCTDSEQEALALALRHRRGGRIWRIEARGMVGVDGGPQADLGDMQSDVDNERHGANNLKNNG